MSHRAFDPEAAALRADQAASRAEAAACRVERAERDTDRAARVRFTLLRGYSYIDRLITEPPTRETMIDVFECVKRVLDEAMNELDSEVTK